jgi:hypothetical protein
MQNGLPFHHGHLTTHPALAGKPLPAVDPSGELFDTFKRHQVVAGVVYIASERTGVAEVESRGLRKNLRYHFGAVDHSCGNNAARSAALNAAVLALNKSGVEAFVVCNFYCTPHPCAA